MVKAFFAVWDEWKVWHHRPYTPAVVDLSSWKSDASRFGHSEIEAFLNEKCQAMVQALIDQAGSAHSAGAAPTPV